MKKILFIAALLLTAHCSLLTSEANGQSRTNRLTRPCAGSTTPATVSIAVDGAVAVTPCSGKTTTVTGNAAITGNAVITGSITAASCTGCGGSSALVYRALLTQTSTNDPTVTVLENTTGTTITWTHAATGVSRATAGSAIFAANKTAVLASVQTNARTIATWRQSTTIIDITTATSSTGASVDGALLESFVQILIYP